MIHEKDIFVNRFFEKNQKNEAWRIWEKHWKERMQSDTMKIEEIRGKKADRQAKQKRKTDRKGETEMSEKKHEGKLTLRLVSSLAKVFADEVAGEKLTEGRLPKLGGLGGEQVSFQAAYFYEGALSHYVKVRVQSELPLCVREVKLVPVSYPCRTGWSDEDYLRKVPGMYPDVLQEIEDGVVRAIEGQWRSVWVEVSIPKGCPAGEYPIKVLLCDMEGEVQAQEQTTVTVVGADLPAQVLKHTEWFHADCLAEYYGVEALSERHWTIMENFIRKAAERGCNMILTPIFTPPLDTEVGTERMTVQLVDVKQTKTGIYEFGFDKLERWVRMCEACGIRYFEMAHLFTQWGALAAPKIVAEVETEENAEAETKLEQEEKADAAENCVWKKKRVFGWDTPADGEAYRGFLKAFLPKLTETLKKLGIADRTYFHISDEPREEHLAQYQRNKELIAPYLKGFPILDALSDIQFYEMGVVEEPVCASNHIEPFLERAHGKIWSYYCISQAVKVSNRFLAMPSSRNRIYGYQVFKFGIEGILHWGYNFYHTERSLRVINPYFSVDGDGSFPAGDAFLVYPGKDGMPEESLRLVVLAEALQDVRAFRLLESLTDHETVVNLVEEGLAEPITFSEYPKGEAFCLDVRARVNQKIEELLKKCQETLRSF